MNASEEENNAEWKSKKDVQPIMYHLICKLKLYIHSNNKRCFIKAYTNKIIDAKSFQKVNTEWRVGNNSV